VRVWRAHLLGSRQDLRESRPGSSGRARQADIGSCFSPLIEIFCCHAFVNQGLIRLEKVTDILWAIASLSRRRRDTTWLGDERVRW
jgi:hypothetical protein